MEFESERQLIDGCRRGDREAQRRLYEETSQKIYRLMLRMTRHSDDAFDLTQEAYVRALSQIDQFDARSSLTTWLYRIAVNQALQFLRRRELGQEKMQVEWVRGKRQGPMTVWDEYGNVQSQVEYADGVPQP